MRTPSSIGLRKNSKGESVDNLQQFLKKFGYLEGKNNEVREDARDANFGNETEIALQNYQTKSEAKLREYLEDNLSREAKEKYKIYIFKDDIDKLEKEHREYLQENNLNK